MPTKLEKSINRPAPKGGRHRRIKLPNDFRGIQYEIGVMANQIKEQYSHPAIIDASRQIATRWGRFVEDTFARRGENISVAGSESVQLEGLFIWCEHHFVYVNDPIDKEVIQSPLREYRQTKLGLDFIEMIMEPFYLALEADDPEFVREDYEPPPLYVGDCDEALVLVLSMAAALGMHPIKFRFGATDGEIHHVWGQVTADGEPYDIDLTVPHYSLGDYGDYDHYEEMEIFE